VYHITELSIHPKTLQKRYCIWNSDFTVMHDIDLSEEKFKAFRAKKNVRYVSWMEVLAQGCEVKKTGRWAKEVPTLAELRG